MPAPASSRSRAIPGSKGEPPMSSVQTALLGRTTAAPAADVESLALYRIALWALLAGNLIAGWGVQWDIQWHVRVGRDSFWIPPHVMTYGGVAIVVLVSFGVLARDTLRHLVGGRAPRGTTRVAGVTGTPGFYLAACGIDRKSTRLNSSHRCISY